jgi:hypothetical protein
MGQQIVTSSSDSIVSLPVTADVVAGDYFYEWGNGSSGWPKPATISFGQTRVVAGANRTLEFLSGSGRAASSGTFVDSLQYTGSTIAVNAVTTASASLQAFAGFQAKVATLTNGNFVSVYMSAANTLSAQVFNASGAQVGSTLSLSTTVASASATLFAGQGKFDVAGLSTGGYVVVFKHQTLNTIHIVTASAANAIVSGPTAINAAISVSAAEMLSVAANNIGGYVIAWRNTTLIGSALYNSSNTYVGGTSSAISLGTYAYNGISDAFPKAFVLNNGVMGIAVSLWGSTCASVNWILVASLNATGSAANTAIINAPTFGGTAGSSGLAVAASSATPNLGMVIAGNDSATSQLTVRIFSIDSAGVAPVQVGSGVTLNGTIQTSKPELIPNADGTFTLIFKASASSTMRQDISATPTLIGSNVSINTANTLNYISACPLAYKAAVALTPTATNFPSQFIFQTDAVTNGATYIGPTTYSPATGYYVKGIALETVSAGGVCKVGTKGQFSLGAGYPSTTAYFDYVGTATSGVNIIKGNSGSVTTTNVTLQGLK